MGAWAALGHAITSVHAKLEALRAADDEVEIDDADEDLSFDLPAEVESMVREKLAWLRFEERPAHGLVEAFGCGYHAVEPPDDEGCVDPSDLLMALCNVNEPHERNLDHEEGSFLVFAYAHACGDVAVNGFIGTGRHFADLPMASAPRATGSTSTTSAPFF